MFPTFGTLEVRTIRLCLGKGGLWVHRTFSSSPALYPLDTSSTFPLTPANNQKCLQTLPTVPWGGTSQFEWKISGSTNSPSNKKELMVTSDRIVRPLFLMSPGKKKCLTLPISPKSTWAKSLPRWLVPPLKPPTKRKFPVHNPCCDIAILVSFL